MLYEYRNPRYNHTGTIDCEINHPQWGWSLYTASPNDVEETGRKLYEKIINDGVEIAEYVPPEPPSDEQVAMWKRQERDELLKETDWTQLPDVPQPTKEKWAEYRQLLRDIPQQPNFPHDIEWPRKP